MPATCPTHCFLFPTLLPHQLLIPAPQDCYSHFSFQFSTRMLPVIYFPCFSPSFSISPVAPANPSTHVPLSPRASEYFFFAPIPAGTYPPGMTLPKVICFTTSPGDNSALAMESHIRGFFKKQREKGIDTGPLRADERRALLWVGHPADSCPEAALYTCDVIPCRPGQTKADIWKSQRNLPREKKKDSALPTGSCKTL